MTDEESACTPTLLHNSSGIRLDLGSRQSSTKAGKQTTVKRKMQTPQLLISDLISYANFWTRLNLQDIPSSVPRSRYNITAVHRTIQARRWSQIQW